MKILLIHNSYTEEGGEERVLSNLEQLLRSKNQETFRFERSSRQWSQSAKWRKIIDGFQMIYSIDTARRLQQTIEHIKPDIAHLQNVFPLLSPSVYWTLRRLNIPVVQSVHNYRFMCANGLFMTPDNQICERCKGGNFLNAVRFGCYHGSRLYSIPMAATLMIHRTLKTFTQCIDRYVVSTDFVKNKLVEAGFPEAKIILIRNPSPSAPVIPAHRSATPLFIYCGRHSREKGLWTLLQAFQANDLGELKIAGQGPLTQELSASIEKHHTTHIQMLGRISNEQLSQLIGQAWALIVPSEVYEVAPQVMVEAWQHGTPVIASRLGGMAEMIQEGQNGWTFTAGDFADLQRIVRKLIHDVSLLKHAWETSQSFVAQHYNNESIYEKLVSVYESALEEHRAPVAS